MSYIITNRRLTDALIAQGLVPPKCGDIELQIPPNGAVVLRYKVFVTDVALDKLAAAFAAAAVPMPPAEKDEPLGETA